MAVRSLPPSSPVLLNRRRWVQRSLALAGAAWMAPAMAQSASASRTAAAGGGTAGERPAVVAQIVDLSATQQDVGRDFLVGSRTAWQDASFRNAGAGRRLQHLTLEVDGSAASIEAAWRRLEHDENCIAVCGSVGNTVSAALLELQARSQTAVPLPIVGPWLHHPPANHPVDAVFELFAGHEAQILHALRGLSSLGVRQFGVVYATPALQKIAQSHVAAAARTLQMGVQPVSAEQTPAIVLFIGGTPELHAFVQQLRLPPGRQCYVVSLADVNLQVFAQMGGVPKNASVIATQPVPMTTAGLPIVRAYREGLARLYDEPPSPQGLAGFIAARYLGTVLQGLAGPWTRAPLLAALQRRAPMDLGGFPVAFQGQRRQAAPVTQTMLTADLRIIG